MQTPTPAAVGAPISATKYNQLVGDMAFSEVFSKTAVSNAASSTSFGAATGLASLVTHGLWSQSAGVYTCVVPGVYRVEMLVEWSGNATGTRGVGLASSALPIARYKQETPLSATLSFTQSLVMTLTFGAGDTVSPTIQQNSGAALGWTGEMSFTALI